MGQSFFTWNGIDCRSMGVWLQNPVAVIRPEERVEHIQIPGRPGDLTMVEGEDIYNSYIQTATLLVKGRQNIKEVYQWLRGSGYVSFSEDPDKKQAARIIGAITLNKYSRNQEWYVGECQFYCQPFKELLTDTPITTTLGMSTVRNNGDVICKPLYKVTVASGKTAVTLQTVWTEDGVSRQRTITVTGLTAGASYYIDCESMEVYNSAGTEMFTKNSRGAFPVLGVGDNTVNLTYISSIEITKRERYL